MRALPASRTLARRSLLLAAALLAGAGLGRAQTLDSVSPAAGGPGDLVILKGADLHLVTGVVFTGSVGGFAGFLSQPGAIQSQSATEIRVTVPTIGGFVGPQATPPSGPLGWLTLTEPGGSAPKADFFFFEDPGAELETVGQGSTQSGGMGRAVTTFDVAQGPPKILKLGLAMVPPTIWAPNKNFTLRLVNAMPSAPALILFGAPAATPYLPIGDGDLVIDLGAYVGYWAGITDADGNLDYPIPVPDGLSGTLMMQFVSFDGGALSLASASGLQAIF